MVVCVWEAIGAAIGGEGTLVRLILLNVQIQHQRLPQPSQRTNARSSKKAQGRVREIVGRTSASKPFTSTITAKPSSTILLLQCFRSLKPGLIHAAIISHLLQPPLVPFHYLAYGFHVSLTGFSRWTLKRMCSMSPINS